MKKEFILTVSAIVISSVALADVSVSSSAGLEYIGHDKEEKGGDLGLSSKEISFSASGDSDNGITVSLGSDFNTWSDPSTHGSAGLIDGNFGEISLSTGSTEFLTLHGGEEEGDDHDHGFTTPSTYVGASWKHDLMAPNSGLALGASFEANDDDATMGSLGVSYVTSYEGVGVGISLGYSASDNGDSTSMPEGFNGEILASMGPITLDVKATEGKDYDHTTIAGISYKLSEDLTIGAAYSATMNVGDEENEVDMTSAGVSYAFASGVSATLGYAHIEGDDEVTGETTSSNSWYIGAKVAL